MHRQTRRFLKAAQTYIPFAKPLKDEFYLRSRRLRRRPHDADFRCLEVVSRMPGVMVDVGANQGQSIESIRVCAPGAEIVSFEANPLLAQKMARRYAGAGDVTLHPVGLGDVRGDFDLYTPVYRGFVYDGLASLDRREAEEFLNPRSLLGFTASNLRLRQLRCRVERLDDFGLQPVFVKIDVQGFERNVILGGLDTIRTHEPVLLIEGFRHQAPLQELLRSLGYSEYRRTGTRLVSGPNSGRNSFLLTARRAEMMNASLRSAA